MDIDIKNASFDDVVKWATWRVIEGITRGEKLNSVMYGIILAFSNAWNK